MMFFPDPLPPADLLSYAATLAPYTSAPPSFDPATTPHSGPGAFFPPFPTEHSMRRGRLNAGGELGVVGQTSEGARATHPASQTLVLICSLTFLAFRHYRGVQFKICLGPRSLPRPSPSSTHSSSALSQQPRSLTSTSIRTLTTDDELMIDEIVSAPVRGMALPSRRLRPRRRTGDQSITIRDEDWLVKPG